ncbi:MAG: baseplate J/gp47 family protein, partial [Bacteroidota bacterium]
MSTSKIKIEEGLTIENLVKELIKTSGERVILEVPKNATLLTNEINLRLLKFYAEEEEKEIVINSDDPFVTGLAQKLGIATLKENQLTFAKRRAIPEPVYQKAEIEIAASPEIGVETVGLGWIQMHGGLQFAIIISLFSLILASWWVLQPRAIVMVYPKEQTLTFSAGAQIGAAFNPQEILAGKIPAKILEKDNQIKVQTITTGSRVVGVTPAVGRLTLINSTGQPVILPKGSIALGRGGVRFLTDQDVMVPKRQTKFRDGIAVGEEYGRAEVNITAEKKGTIGNQPAKSITGLNGKYQRFLKVINASPTKNGSDKKVAVVTLADVKKGEEEAKRQMQLVGNEELSNLAGKEYLGLPELIQTEIIRVMNTPDIGAESDLLQTTLDYRIIILSPLI